MSRRDLQHDAYVVHAGEDRLLAEALAAALRARGLVVWCNSFRLGHSVRREMEAGLAASSFGVILVTPALFEKRWAMEELDALFAMSELDDGRIMPVWRGVSYEDVVARSPMLASRFALHHDDDVDATAATLAEAILRQTAASSPGRWLRAQVATGFAWHPPGPAFLPASLRHYDEHHEEFSPAGLSRHPDPAPDGIVGEPCSLMDLSSEVPLRDGAIVTVIGTQDPGSRQVIEHHFEVDDDEGNPWSIVSYVFQMRSVEFDGSQVVYVHALGPRRRGLQGAGDGPWGDDLCWVTGAVIAHGVVPTRFGIAANCAYIAARAIFFTPAVSDDLPA